MKHVITALTNNKFGVTTRVSGLFRRRGYNIDSFVGSSTEDERFSRLTFVVQGDDDIIAQMIGQLEKLEDIISVEDMLTEDMISKVLLFLKIKAGSNERIEIIMLASASDAKIIEIKNEYIIIEALDTEEKISEMVEIYRPYGILEMVKTGIVAIKR